MYLTSSPVIHFFASSSLLQHTGCFCRDKHFTSLPCLYSAKLHYTMPLLHFTLLHATLPLPYTASPYLYITRLIYALPLRNKAHLYLSFAKPDFTLPLPNITMHRYTFTSHCIILHRLYLISSQVNRPLPLFLHWRSPLYLP